MALATGHAQAATIEVNSTADTIADDGTCTMREALFAADDNFPVNPSAGECAAGDAAPTIDEIDFSILPDGSGVHTITPATSLPALEEAIDIDGSTDPDAIEFDMDNAGVGLSLDGDSSELRNVFIFNSDPNPNSVGVSSAGSDLTVFNVEVGFDSAGNAGGFDMQGLVSLGDDALVESSTFGNNGHNGIAVFGDRAELKDVNVGVAEDGLTAAPNGGTAIPSSENAAGILARGADFQLTVSAGNNIVSGNAGDGISVGNVGFGTPPPTSNAKIELTRIGVDGAGNSLPNGSNGIEVRDNAPTGTITANWIAGNPENGIELIRTQNGAPTDYTIRRNLILDNGISGIRLSGGGSSATGTIDGTTIGGTNPSPNFCNLNFLLGACNVIGGNATGISLIGYNDPAPSITGTMILGNRVGLLEDGISQVGNLVGISLDNARGTTIGSPAAPNVISASETGVPGTDTGIGIVAGGEHLSDTRIQANWIGTGPGGAGDKGNQSHGILLGLKASDVTIGGLGDGEGNTIQFNEGDGIRIRKGAAPALNAIGNPILGNSINENFRDDSPTNDVDLGIDLITDGEDADGVNVIDPLDPDTGGNNGQNQPELDQAARTSEETIVTGGLSSLPSSDFRIEFFWSPGSDDEDLNLAEGRDYLGSTQASTDSAGEADFAATVDSTFLPFGLVTATATLLSGGEPVETSEFSAPTPVGGCDIPGTSGPDVLNGTAADEIICGEGGDDLIDGGGGDDLVVGGSGADTSTYATSPTTVSVDLGAGSATGGAGSDQLAGIENAIGSSFSDAIVGDDGANELSGGDGADNIGGEGGADTIDGGEGVDTIEGGADGDEIDGREGGDEINGGDGADLISGGDGDDTIDGGSDSDTIDGDNGGDDLKGGGGDDDITGNEGSDDVAGDAGDDDLDGAAGDDTIDGGDGDDALNGADGIDVLDGGRGNDTIDGAGGSDTLIGAEGRDILRAGGGSDVLKAGGGSGDIVKGGGGSDNLKGGGGNGDVLRGGSGSDTMAGQGGKRDMCVGGSGRDRAKRSCEKVKGVP